MKLRIRTEYTIEMLDCQHSTASVVRRLIDSGLLLHGKGTFQRNLKYEFHRLHVRRHRNWLMKASSDFAAGNLPVIQSGGDCFYQ